MRSRLSYSSRVATGSAPTPFPDGPVDRARRSALHPCGRNLRRACLDCEDRRPAGPRWAHSPRNRYSVDRPPSAIAMKLDLAVSRYTGSSTSRVAVNNTSRYDPSGISSSSSNPSQNRMASSRGSEVLAMPLHSQRTEPASAVPRNVIMCTGEAPASRSPSSTVAVGPML